jgi:hypothetical protein
MSSFNWPPPPPSLASNVVTGEVDFGFPSSQEGDVASTTLSAPWATSTTPILCQVLPSVTVDHDVEDAIVEALQAYVSAIVPGVSITITCVAPQNTWGKYKVTAAILS